MKTGDNILLRIFAFPGSHADETPAGQSWRDELSYTLQQISADAGTELTTRPPSAVVAGHHERASAEHLTLHGAPHPDQLQLTDHSNVCIQNVFSSRVKSLFSSLSNKRPVSITRVL